MSFVEGLIHAMGYGKPKQPLIGTRSLRANLQDARWLREQAERLLDGKPLGDSEARAVAMYLLSTLKPRAYSKPRPEMPPAKRGRGAPKRPLPVPAAEIYRWVKRVQEVRGFKLKRAGAFSFVASLFPHEKLTAAQVERAYYEERARQEKIIR